MTTVEDKAPPVPTDFSVALANCLSCGANRDGQGLACPHCGTSCASASSDATGILGRQASIGRNGPYVVVASAADEMTVLDEAGNESEVPAKRVRVRYPERFPGVATQLGEILVAYGGATGSLRDALMDRCTEAAKRDIRSARGLAEDAIRLDTAEVIPQLGLSATEQLWWLAVGHWTHGRRARSLQHFDQLPDGLYRLRLAYYLSCDEVDWEASDLSQDRVTSTLSAFAQGPENLVASMVRAALDPTPATSGVLVEAASLSNEIRSGESATSLGGILTGAVGQSAASRLLGGLFYGPTRLGNDPEVLLGAARSIVDDLIDRGAITQWRDASSYITARVDISSLDIDTIKELGAEVEVARRRLIESGELPASAPPEAVERFGPVAAVRRGDTSAVAQLVAHSSIPPSDLVAAIEEIGSLPTAEVLADESLASWLADRADPDIAPDRELGDTERQFVASVKLRAAKDAARNWDWTGTGNWARECLRHSRLERQRDEALNLLAFSKWQLGETEAALSALETALEDDYTEALLANVAIVAADLDDEVAAQHLSRLVAEAPSQEMRVAAARQAVLIWGRSEEPWASDDDLPSNIAEAIRSTVVGPLDEESFIDFLRLLASHDEAWLAERGALRGSPHSASDAARVFQAKARGIEDFITELAGVLRSSKPAWALDERDRLVGALLSVIVDPDPPLGAVVMGMAVIEADLPMETDDRAVLRAFVARGAALSIDLDEGEPSDKFIDWLEEAARDLSGMPAEYQDRAKVAIKLGFNTLALAYYQARWGSLAEVANMHDAVINRLRFVPRYRIDRTALRGTIAPAREYVENTRSLFGRLRPHVDSTAREAVDEIDEFARELSRALQDLMR